MTIDEGQRARIEALAHDIREHTRLAHEAAIELGRVISDEPWADTTVKAEDLAPVGVEPMARVLKSVTTYGTREVVHRPGCNNVSWHGPESCTGWVSDNRCPEATTLNDTAFKGHIGAAPHPAHPYSRDGLGDAYWCDGYV